MENDNSNTKTKRKKIITGIIISLLVIIVGGGIFYFAKNKNTQTSKAMGADIALEDGEAFFKAPNSDRYEELKQGDSVYAGYSIKSMDNAKVVIVFDSGDIIRLNSNTEILLSEINSEKISTKEIDGEVYSRVEPSQSKKFEIITEDYPAQAMGTAYSTKYKKNEKKVEYKVMDSKIKVGREDKNKEVDISKKAKLNLENGEIEVTDMDMVDVDDSFIVWNKEQDEKDGKQVPAYNMVKERSQNQIQEENKQEEQTSEEKYFKLTASTTDEGVYFKWSISGYDIPSGFKVLKDSPDKSPVYPGSAYQYLTNSNTRSYSWKLTNGETYNFRVCTYNGKGACLAYSNIVKLTVPKVEETKKDNKEATSSVNSISLSGSKPAAGKASLAWSVDGNSPLGFKVVWSKNPGPTYPCRSGDSYHYLSSSSAASDLVTGLESGQTYYFRVCEYLGGKCGKYSNEISLVID